MLTTLTTDRLNLRLPCASDLPAFTAFATSARSEHIGAGKRCSETDAFRILAILIGHWTLRGYGTFTACLRDTDRPVGSIGPWHPAGWPEPEIGWTIWSPDDEGQGYAQEAAQACIRHVYDDLGWDTVVSYIAPANAASIALAERLGARRDLDVTASDPDDLVYRHPRPGGTA